MEVYKISEAHAEFLRDIIRPDGSRFNVDVRDADGNIIISEEVIDDARLVIDTIGEPIEYKRLTKENG